MSAATKDADINDTQASASVQTKQTSPKYNSKIYIDELLNNDAPLEIRERLYGDGKELVFSYELKASYDVRTWDHSKMRNLKKLTEYILCKCDSNYSSPATQFQGRLSVDGDETMQDVPTKGSLNCQWRDVKFEKGVNLSSGAGYLIDWVDDMTRGDAIRGVSCIGLILRPEHLSRQSSNIYRTESQGKEYIPAVWNAETGTLSATYNLAEISSRIELDEERTKLWETSLSIEEENLMNRKRRKNGRIDTVYNVDTKMRVMGRIVRDRFMISKPQITLSGSCLKKEHSVSKQSMLTDHSKKREWNETSLSEEDVPSRRLKDSSYESVGNVIPA